MATIRDVAALAGVSASTVSLALSDPARVSPSTLARVRNAVDAVGFSVNPLAQSLARGRSRLIGFVSGNVGNPFFGDIRREIETYAIEHEHFVVIGDTAGQPERERMLVEHLSRLKVAGFAVAASGHDEAFVALVRGMTVPVVTFDQKVPGLDRDFVGSDNRLASAMLTEHLLQLGHRRIAFIAGPAQLHTASERLRGFTETMLSAGVDVDPDLVVDGQFTRLAGYEQAMRLLVRPDRPSAIIGANNSMALAALQAMQELSFDCPGDISLAMIDDVQWSSVITPKITMVVQDTARLGSLVGHRLLHRMMSPEGAAAPAEDFVLTPKFVPGNSCRRI